MRCTMHRDQADLSGLAEQFGGLDDLLGDFAQTHFFRHRELAQRVVRLVFREAARLHQQPLGAVHEFAFRELQVGFGEFDLQLLVFLEARAGDLDDAVDELLSSPSTM